MKKGLIDYVRVFCQSGKGGAGAIHFRRAKYIPKGGPDGGDGGRGGSVVLVAKAQLNTLRHLIYKKHLRAGPGGSGGGNHRKGAQGRDLLVSVPVGTVVRDAENQAIEAELIAPEQTYVLLKGGIGGKGNAFFKRANNQTPRKAHLGGPAQAAWKILELRLLADVGLLGMPNAGKSTLLQQISGSKTAVGAYPFTTRAPELGQIQRPSKKPFTVADLPGLIVGASKGKGLGDRFLKHVQRTRILSFVIPADAPDPAAHYKTLLAELKAFDPDLLNRQRVCVISKMDLCKEGHKKEQEMRAIVGDRIPVYLVSAHRQTGLDCLLEGWSQLI